MVQDNGLNHYFSENPGSEVKTKDIEITVSGFQFSFTTFSGVFSFGRRDRGSLVLCENSILKGDVLDLGCGWGLVGITAKKRCPSCKIVMSDVNPRAVEASRINAKLNHVKIESILSKGYSKIKSNFDTILFNPPQHAGRKICLQLIEQSKDHLNPDGTLQLVCRHNKGGSYFERFMRELFGNVKTLVRSGGYRVYLSSK